jgi:four helix bundle protein
MAKIIRFEDIEAWKRAKELVVEVYRVTERGIPFRKDMPLKDQIRRAATSVMSNIAEGFSRQTDKEFVHFLYMSLGSAAEVQSQLYIALDLRYIAESDFTNLSGKAQEISRLIHGFIKYLKTGTKSGPVRRTPQSGVHR